MVTVVRRQEASNLMQLPADLLPTKWQEVTFILFSL